MTLQQIKSVVILSEKLNFTRAAEELNIVQPALSRQIKQLEEQIGAILFTRDKRNVKLTPAGQYFVKEVKKQLAQLERIKKQTVNIHNGHAERLT